MMNFIALSRIDATTSGTATLNALVSHSKVGGSMTAMCYECLPCLLELRVWKLRGDFTAFESALSRIFCNGQHRQWFEMKCKFNQ